MSNAILYVYSDPIHFQNAKEKQKLLNYLSIYVKHFCPTLKHTSNTPNNLLQFTNGGTHGVVNAAA